MMKGPIMKIPDKTNNIPYNFNLQTTILWINTLELFASKRDPSQFSHSGLIEDKFRLAITR